MTNDNLSFNALSMQDFIREYYPGSSIGYSLERVDEALYAQYVEEYHWYVGGCQQELDHTLEEVVETSPQQFFNF
jgi:hypothetical protein